MKIFSILIILKHYGFDRKKLHFNYFAKTNEAAPITLKSSKPLSDVLSLPNQHSGIQNIVNQHYKLSETQWLCALVAKKDT